MKVFSLSLGFALLTSTSAHCTFRLKVANSANEALNGLYVTSFDNVASVGHPFENITAVFPDPDITTESTLQSTGVPGEGNGMFMLAPSLGVERIVFTDDPPAGARYTEWSLLQSVVSSTRLTYGIGVDRFIVYSPPSPVAHYEIYWVPQGVMFGGYPVDLVAECVNGGGCTAS